MAMGPRTVRTVAGRRRRYRAICPQAQGRSGSTSGAASIPHTPPSRALPSSCAATNARRSTSASVRGAAPAQRLSSWATVAICAAIAARNACVGSGPVVRSIVASFGVRIAGRYDSLSLPETPEGGCFRTP